MEGEGLPGYTAASQQGADLQVKAGGLVGRLLTEQLWLCLFAEPDETGSRIHISAVCSRD